jgi:hypothetical protein
MPTKPPAAARGTLNMMIRGYKKFSNSADMYAMGRVLIY